MLPIRWDPMRELGTLQREFDDLVRRVFGTTGEKGTALPMIAVPAINSFVKDGILHLEAELPGVDTDKLDVRVDGRELVLRGERRETHKVEQADYLLHEARASTFERRLTLPDGVDTEKIHASYKDGLLEITMPIGKVEAIGRKVMVEGLPAGKKSKEIH